MVHSTKHNFLTLKLQTTIILNELYYKINKINKINYIIFLILKKPVSRG